MAVVRGRVTFEDHFFVFSNAWARDERISHKSRGVLAMLMSHRDGWRASVDSLTTGKDGAAAVRSALAELEVAGYLVRERGQDEGGRFTWDMELCDPFSQVAPCDGFPHAVEPHMVEPHAVNRDPKNTNSKKTNNPPNPQGGEDGGFEAWYALYPRKSAKGAARRAFKSALAKTDLGTLMRTAELYAASVSGREAKYIKMPSSWLNGECWDDDYGDVKITPRGFDAWFGEAVSLVDTATVERVLGLMFPMPDEVPPGVSRARFLEDARRSWLESVRDQAKSRWVVQFGDLLTGP